MSKDISAHYDISFGSQMLFKKDKIRPIYAKAWCRSVFLSRNKM